jgi:hypothetical protein
MGGAGLAVRVLEAELTELHIQLIQGDVVTYCAPAFWCIKEVAHSIR